MSIYEQVITMSANCIILQSYGILEYP